MKILVTGGAGYVGSVLVPRLLDKGFKVNVLDMYFFGDTLKDHPNLKEFKGDIRDKKIVDKAMRGCDTVIHLACISNDPSFELNPELSKSVNYDGSINILNSAIENKIKKFIFASSSSVYGLNDSPNITEDLERNPLTDYSKYKAMFEDYLYENSPKDMVFVIIRPATICGYSPRMRLDLVVNILTNHAINSNRIRVFGGVQKRPNIHIKDMVSAYIKVLSCEDSKIDREIFNVGNENLTLNQIAKNVQDIIGADIPVISEPTDDIRSYHISSEKIKKVLGFVPQYTVKDAISEISDAFSNGNISNNDNDIYYNVKTMKNIKFI